jgi:hypothetical protein
MYQHQGRYTITELGVGWAYGVAPGARPIPAIIVEANMSYSSGEVRRFSYRGGKFVETGCDFVERKQDDSDILDPKSVTVKPC